MKQILFLFVLLLCGASRAQTVSTTMAADYGKDMAVAMLPTNEDSKAVASEKCGKLADLLVNRAKEDFSQIPFDVLMALRSNTRCGALALSDRDIDKLLNANSIQFDAVDELLRRVSEIAETRRKDYEELLGKFKEQQTVKRVVSNASSACTPAIETQTEDDFNGWDDRVIYKLANGQIWQQNNYHYHYHYAYRPSVTIYASDHGCHMKVEDDDDEGADVVRLK
jgi:hypothetical protein